MAGKPPRYIGSDPREGADRIALATAFLLGVGGSVTLKFMDLHPGAGALWSAAVLIGYVLLIWGFGTLRIEPETTGDNCYYLGFVFTLTSLAVTLYQMGDGVAGPVALRDVISGFGIALSSTIVGIVLRVWLLRLRPDLVARDREARIELHAMVRAFRTALADSTAIIKAYAVESSQLMSEEHTKLRSITEEMLQSTRQSMYRGATVQMQVLERAMEDGAAAIATAVEQALTSSSNTLSESVAEIRASLAEFVQRESETMRKLVANSISLSEGGGEVDKALTDVAGRLGLLVTRLEQTSETISRRLTDASGTIETSVDAATRRIEVSFGEFAEAAERFAGADYHRRAAEACERSIAALETATARFTTVAAGIEHGSVRGAPLRARGQRHGTGSGQSAGTSTPKSESVDPEADVLGASNEPVAPPGQSSKRTRRWGFLEISRPGE